MATTVVPPITSTPVTTTTGSSSSSSSSSTTTAAGLADNFQTFLTLLTTQLQNQNPLDPLDTNQFTQQLVQFAQVEQQLKSNDQLSSLVSLQKTAQSSNALNFVGKTAVVDGNTAALSNGQASWSITAPVDANATVVITNSVGQTVFTGDYSITAGPHAFNWDGKSKDGTQWPAGNYKITVSGKDTSGNAIAMSTEVQGNIDSADLTANPPLLTIGGQTYTVDQIKRVVSASTSS